MPLILSFCVVGSYALSGRFFDVWTMFGFALFGLVLEAKRIPLAPFVLGFVLWPMAEESLSAGLMSTNGDMTPVVTRPLSLMFLSVAVVVLMAPMITRRLKGRVA